MLVMAFLAVSCGGSGGPAGSPYSPVIRIAKQGEFVALPPAGDDFANAANAVVVAVVNNPVSGASLRAAIKWTSPSNVVQAAFFTGECTVEQVITPDGCPVAQFFPAAELVTGRTLDLYSANSGNFTLAIVNLGPGAESGTYQVELILPTTGSTY
jgi:hypothetical protein